MAGRSTRARSRYSTTTVNPSAPADEERDLQPEHDRPGPDHQVPAGTAEPGPVDRRAHRQQRLHRGAQRADLDSPRLVRRHCRGGRGTCPRASRSTWSATGSPPTARARWANDTNTVLRGAQNPVLAHLFLNYLEDLPNALTNISFNGYMQPVNGGHAAAPGHPRHPAAEPDLHRGAAVLLPARGQRAAAAHRGRPAVAAGLADRQPRRLGGPGDRGRQAGQGGPRGGGGANASLTGFSGQPWPHRGSSGWRCCSSCRSTSWWRSAPGS